MSIAAAIDACKGGDYQGFADIIKLTYNDIYYISLKYLQTKSAADSVTTEVYSLLKNNINVISSENMLLSWLNETLLDISLKSIKRNKPMLFSFTGGEDKNGDSVRYLTEDDTLPFEKQSKAFELNAADITQKLLQSLSDEQRLCAVAYFYCHMEKSAICRSLGILESTLISRLYYARNSIRKAMASIKLPDCGIVGLPAAPFLEYIMQAEKRTSTIQTMTIDSMNMMLSSFGVKQLDTKSQPPKQTQGITQPQLTGIKPSEQDNPPTAQDKGSLSAFLHSQTGIITISAVVICVVLGVVLAVVFSNMRALSTGNAGDGLGKKQKTDSSESSESSSASAAANNKQVEHSEFKEKISGSLSASELEVVLSYLPVDWQNKEAESFINSFCYYITHSEERIFDYEKDEDSGYTTFNAEDLNRLFESFGNYKVESENDDGTFKTNVEDVSIVQKAHVGYSELSGSALTVRYVLEVEEGDSYHTEQRKATFLDSSATSRYILNSILIETTNLGVDLRNKDDTEIERIVDSTTKVSTSTVSSKSSGSNAASNMTTDYMADEVTTATNNSSADSSTVSSQQTSSQRTSSQQTSSPSQSAFSSTPQSNYHEDSVVSYSPTVESDNTQQPEYTTSEPNNGEDSEVGNENYHYVSNNSYNVSNTIMNDLKDDGISYKKIDVNEDEIVDIVASNGTIYIIEKIGDKQYVSNGNKNFEGYVNKFYTENTQRGLYIILSELDEKYRGCKFSENLSVDDVESGEFEEYDKDNMIKVF